MSWLTGLAGKAEELLNKVDQQAATALHNEDSAAPAPNTGNHQSWGSHKDSSSGASGHSSYLSPAPTQQAAMSSMTASKSVPSNLNRFDNGFNSRSRKSISSSPVPQNGSPAKKKDKDDELFEFLNSSTTVENKKPALAVKTGITNGTHSRHSSTSSSASTKSGKTTESGLTNSSLADKQVADETDSLDQSTNDIPDDATNNHDSSSGYHSNQEDSQPPSSQVSALELENKLLKNEVASLNDEMRSVIQRAKDAQTELNRLKKQMMSKQSQMTQSDQMLRELQSRENDFQEALQAKDSQLAVLRVRWEEADKELAEKRHLLADLHSEKTRILQDHTDSSGLQSQAMDAARDKVQEADAALRREKEAFKMAQEESMQRQSKLDAEVQTLAESVRTTQKRLNEERARVSDTNNQLKTAKSQAEAAKEELNNYKDKATRILQSKERLIASLKEGSGAAGENDTSVMSIELEEMKNERDHLKDEVQHSKMAIDNLRAELQELEVQLQTDSDAAQDEIQSLEEQLEEEKRKREDADHELHKQKQELSYALEELHKQKSGLQGQIQDRDLEIQKLRQQLTTKSMSSTSQSELENRLHALTESLIQKQTMLEALSTEKNSLGLQLERLENQYKDVQASVTRASTTAIHMNEDEEVRHRVPGFMREAISDTPMTRKMKRAAHTIDKFSVRLGVFLRRYPIARVFVIVYMFLLHLWVMIVLLTYQPEMHGSHYNPQPPETMDK